MFSLPTTVKIGDDWWLVKEADFEEEPDKFGECDFDNKCIRLNTYQPDQDRPLTLAHELLHAAVPDLAEDAVVRYENALKSANIFK